MFGLDALMTASKGKKHCSQDVCGYCHEHHTLRAVSARVSYYSIPLPTSSVHSDDNIDNIIQFYSTWSVFV